MRLLSGKSVVERGSGLGNLFSGCRIRRPEFVWFHLRRFWHQPLLGSERERRKVIYNFAGRGSRYRGQDKLNRQGSFMKWAGLVKMRTCCRQTCWIKWAMSCHCLTHKDGEACSRKENQEIQQKGLVALPLLKIVLFYNETNINLSVQLGLVRFSNIAADLVVSICRC